MGILDNPMNGLSYPIARTSTGSLHLTPSSDLDSRVIQAIESVVRTHTGERVMRPLYGSPNAIFDTMDLSTAIAAYDKAIKGALEHFGSSVGVRVFGAIAEDGLTLRVHYVTPTAEDFLTFAALNGFV